MEWWFWSRFACQILIINIPIIILLIAVQLLTAIFLYGNGIRCTYNIGKTEIIDQNKTGDNAISSITIDSYISFGQILATGIESRGEFLFNKNKLFRLGSSSLAKWSNPHDLWLHSGSILICIPENDAFSISTTGSTASFKGTGTFIIETTQNGGFKFIPLEGKGIISTANGGQKEILGGRMILILGSPSYFGDAYDIDLMLLLKSSRLVSAYPKPLPRMRNIILALYIQDIKLKGKYDALIGDATSENNLQIWKFGNKMTE